MAIGGSPDAAAVRSQLTILCSDFELCAKNKKAVFSMWDELSIKGWTSLTKIAPPTDVAVDFNVTRTTLIELKDTIANMTQEARSTLTVHVHLSLQAVVLESMSFPLQESSASAREAAESILRDVYVMPLIEILKLIPRPPIVSINHDLRLVQLQVRLYDVVVTSLGMAHT